MISLQNVKSYTNNMSSPLRQPRRTHQQKQDGPQERPSQRQSVPVSLPPWRPHHQSSSITLPPVRDLILSVCDENNGELLEPTKYWEARARTTGKGEANRYSCTIPSASFSREEDRRMSVSSIGSLTERGERFTLAERTRPLYGGAGLNLDQHESVALRQSGTWYNTSRQSPRTNKNRHTHINHEEEYQSTSFQTPSSRNPRRVDVPTAFSASNMSHSTPSRLYYSGAPENAPLYGNSGCGHRVGAHDHNPASYHPPTQDQWAARTHPGSHSIYGPPSLSHFQHPYPGTHAQPSLMFDNSNRRASEITFASTGQLMTPTLSPAYDEPPQPSHSFSSSIHQSFADSEFSKVPGQNFSSSERGPPYLHIIHRPDPRATSSPKAGWASDSKPSQPSERKKRRGNHPKGAKEVLLKWLHDHVEHPYPSETDKELLGQTTGLSPDQIANWFINARRRIVKPLQIQKRLSKDRPADELNEAELLRQFATMNPRGLDPRFTQRS